jgi:hypothetical protein
MSTNNDANVILVFWDGMMCRTLVHELNREPLKTTKELLDIATRQVSGVEEVGAAFILATTKSVRKGTKSGAPSALPL